ncbi:MAG: hypothetical protein ACTH2U_06040 [Brevibacterium sp.]
MEATTAHPETTTAHPEAETAPRRTRDRTVPTAGAEQTTARTFNVRAVVGSANSATQVSLRDPRLSGRG